MALRHCHVCGPAVRHQALLMHRLDGYMSTFDRVVWLCGRHWAEAQKSPVPVGSGSETPSGEITVTEPVMMLAQPDLVERVLEMVA